MYHFFLVLQNILLAIHSNYPSDQGLKYQYQYLYNEGPVQHNIIPTLITIYAVVAHVDTIYFILLYFYFYIVLPSVLGLGLV